MKIYLLIIRGWSFLLNAFFPKKVCNRVYENILEVYQKDIVLPSSYHTRYIFPYRNPVIKRCIWNFKFHRREPDRRALLSILEDEIIALMSDQLLLCPLNIIYPPSSSFENGNKNFNHMKDILSEIGLGFISVIHDAVSINTSAKTQHTGTQKERAEWSRNKYKLNKLPNTYYIICIDDVLTTGNTLKAINSLFKNKKIFNLTLCG